MTDHYRLSRDSQESTRLDEQHVFWTASFGYKIHPSIAKTLPGNPRIADLATGTGAWLIDVAKEYPHGKFHGFDISRTQFPAGLPPQFRFHLHDLREAPPPDLCGQFDVVNLRLLLSFMRSSDWKLVLRNAKALLKAGGWVQWFELDGRPHCHVLRGDANSAVKSLDKCMKQLWCWFEEPFTTGIPSLLEAFDRSGLDRVDKDVVASDRLLEGRRIGTQMELGVVAGVNKRRASISKEDELLSKAVERWLELAYAEIETGAYCLFYMAYVTGQQPR